MGAEWLLYAAFPYHADESPLVLCYERAFLGFTTQSRQVHV